MPARSEVLSNWPIRGEEALHVPGGLEPLHASLPLTCGLMRVLGAIIEVAVLAVLHPREDLPLRSPVAFELVGDEHARHVLAPFEELAEEFLRSFLIPPPLHQDIEHGAVLIHRSPEIVPLLVDCDEYLIQMPFVARPGASPPKLIGVLLAELAAPLPDVRDYRVTGAEWRGSQ